jgi:hypothetical protein
MILKTFTIDSLDLIADEAYKELHKYEQEKSEQKCVWGFFPGLEKNEQKTYPRCLELKDLLDKKFASINDRPDSLKLSFIKMASTKPPVEFGGLHLDDKVSSIDAKTESNILRIVLNLGKYARRIKYVEHSADRLREMGVEIKKGEYQPINLPSGMPTKIIEIPPRDKDRISGLFFWASDILHVGATDEHGYFIAGYGGSFDEMFDLN